MVCVTEHHALLELVTWTGPHRLHLVAASGQQLREKIRRYPRWTLVRVWRI